MLGCHFFPLGDMSRSLVPPVYARCASSYSFAPFASTFFVLVAIPPSVFRSLRCVVLVLCLVPVLLSVLRWPPCFTVRCCCTGFARRLFQFFLLFLLPLGLILLSGTRFFRVPFLLPLPHLFHLVCVFSPFSLSCSG